MEESSGTVSKHPPQRSRSVISDTYDHKIIEPTTHELESKGSGAGWSEVQSNILEAVTEAAAMPISQKCHN